jgi:uncharacterized protein (DUF924 family)
MSTATEVLSFWFGEPARTEAELMQKTRRWFAGGPEVDREIETRFGPDVEQALAGGLTEWESSAHDLLALVLVLDQFPRSIYRNTPRAYAGDARAFTLAARAFDGGMAAELQPIQKHFLGMPFLHAENLAALERCVGLFERFSADAAPPYTLTFEMGLEQAHKYRDIIARFGRFPHRNVILGRESTPEELEFLKDWEAKARPSKFR